MCGIVGGVEINPSLLKERVSLANQMLVHRGPDGQGLKYFNYNELGIAFAHSRLSIIDLSELGYQPMSSSDGDYWIIFNGEIYNYKELRLELTQLGYLFNSETDTEVLLNSWIEWGNACLNRLIGMFAFVLYDRQQERIYCARDAFGIKPFYYYSTSEKFYFCSEIPALFSLINEKISLDKGSLFNYLVRGGYDAGQYTFTKEVKAVRPGTYLTIDLNHGLEVTESIWWNPKIIENEEITFEEATLKLRELFLKSVGLHLRSDVPLGATLSGGIDSSAIVCAIRYLDQDIPIHTFSYIAKNTSFDEENWVDIVNKHVNAIPHKLELKFEDLRDDLDNVIQAQGEPFGSTSIYAQYRIFKLAKENGITVILEGQGADELLGGYNGYPEHSSWSYLDRLDILGLKRFIISWANRHQMSSIIIIRFIIRRVFLNTIEFLVTKINKIRTMISINSQGKNPRIRLRRLTDFLKRKFFRSKYPGWVIDETDALNMALDQLKSEEVEENPKGRRLVQELKRSLQGHYQAGLNSLLRHGDRNAMRWSIEGRVPFLTIELAEFILSLPENFLVSKDGLTKNVFREAMRGIVPDKILDRQDKVGFATPEQDWISMLNKKTFLQELRQLDFIQHDKLTIEIREIINHEKPFNWLVWRVINFSKWYQLNKDKFC